MESIPYDTESCPFQHDPDILRRRTADANRYDTSRLTTIGTFMVPLRRGTMLFLPMLAMKAVPHIRTCRGKSDSANLKIYVLRYGLK